MYILRLTSIILPSHCRSSENSFTCPRPLSQYFTYQLAQFLLNFLSPTFQTYAVESFMADFYYRNYFQLSQFQSRPSRQKDMHWTQPWNSARWQQDDKSYSSCEHFSKRRIYLVLGATWECTIGVHSSRLCVCWPWPLPFPHRISQAVSFQFCTKIQSVSLLTEKECFSIKFTISLYFYSVQV